MISGFGDVPSMPVYVPNYSERSGEYPPSLPAGQAGWPAAPGLPQPHALHIFGAFRQHFDTEHERRHSWSRTRVGQPQAASPSGVHCTGCSNGKPPASLCIPPAHQGADEEEDSEPCLPWTSPWATARVSAPLPPSKPYQALISLDKPFTSSLNHCYHEQPLWWQVQGGHPSLASRPGHGCRCITRDVT